MRAIELYSVPGHDSTVERILQNPVNGSSFERISTLGLISQIITFPCNGGFIHVLIIVQIHDIRYHSILGFIDLERLSVSYGLIAETGRRLVSIPESFFFLFNADLTNTSLYETIRKETGIVFTRSDKVLEIVFANHQEAKYLDV